MPIVWQTHPIQARRVLQCNCFHPCLPEQFFRNRRPARSLPIRSQVKSLAAVGETLRGEETSNLTAHDPGSLMEPFVYLTAFTRGMSPASLVWDIPSTSNAQNPDGQFHGPVRARIALANDYLVPAAAIADQMGSDAIQRTESSFGLDGNIFSLLDMASAYDIFAAQGVRYGQPGLITVLRVEGRIIPFGLIKAIRKLNR